MKNILESIGQGDCKACICDIIPQFCKEKKNLAKRTELIKQCGPDETTCAAGCCPMGPDWYCCPDDMWCAPTAAECPYLDRRVSLVKLAKSNQCGPDETTCAAGCCPMGPNWYCCPDDMWCAPTAAECPYVDKRVSLLKLAKSNQCGPDETTCAAGCCPMGPNWYCCPDDMWCAPTAAECPYVDKRVSLVKLAKSKQCGPDETTCPQGCCPEANWYCCYDAYSCAPSAAECQGRTLF